MMIEIETHRVGLRRFQNSDYENMRLLESDPEVVKYTPMRVPQTPERTREKLITHLEKPTPQRPFGVWACELKSSQDFVGWFMLQETNLEFPELGFMLVPKFWKQGLATEIASALIHSAFAESGVSGLSARTDKDNAGSIRVLEKLGFQLERQIEVPEPILGGTAILNLFRLSKSPGTSENLLENGSQK